MEPAAQGGMIHPLTDVIQGCFRIVAVAAVEDFVVPVGAAGVFVPLGDVAILVVVDWVLGVARVLLAVKDRDLPVGVVAVPLDDVPHTAVTRRALHQGGDVEVRVGQVIQPLVEARVVLAEVAVVRVAIAVGVAVPEDGGVDVPRAPDDLLVKGSGEVGFTEGKGDILLFRPLMEDTPTPARAIHDMPTHYRPTMPRIGKEVECPLCPR